MSYINPRSSPFYRGKINYGLKPKRTWYFARVVKTFDFLALLKSQSKKSGFVIIFYYETRLLANKENIFPLLHCINFRNLIIFTLRISIVKLFNNLYYL